MSDVCTLGKASYKTKGGYNDLDDFCDTRDTLGVGVGKQLHYGRFHPYFARHSSDCAGGRPLSEAMTAANDLQVLIW